jgi:phosphate/sulfate permease
MDPNSYFWIVILGGIFAFMDAFGIGANDVANSFATSVGSRSLTIGQACAIAVFTEFGGAVLLGAETAETVRSGIFKLSLYKNNPEVLMLTFMTALFGSAFWVLFATRMGWPVSTTHSIVGAIGGAAVAGFGFKALEWSTLSKIIMSWFISPALAGAVGAAIYLTTKYAVLRAPNSLQRGLLAVPIYFMLSLGVAFFYVLLKAPKGLDISKGSNAKYIPLAMGIVAGWIALVGLFSYFFLVPYFRRLLVNEENLKIVHIFTPWIAEQPKDPKIHERINLHASEEKEEKLEKGESATVVELKPTKKTFLEKTVSALTKGVTMDVASAQSDRVKAIHDKAVKFDNKTEYLYSYLQVCTAAFASFAHGSNDVANAAGPFSGILEIYNSGKVPESKVPVPFWLLALMGLAIDLGLVLYGYNIMRNLGNNITYHSPSRGFSMELGAALTVITASFLGLPVSTTHCITGATVAVGLCNGEFKAINWRIVSWALFSWIFTLPVAGGVSAGLFLLMSKSPKFG